MCYKGICAYLGSEILGFFWRVIFAVTSDKSTPNFLHRHILNIESNIVTWLCLCQTFMVHFNRFYFSGEHCRCKGNNHTWLQGTSLHTANRHCSNTLTKDQCQF